MHAENGNGERTGSESASCKEDWSSAYDNGDTNNQDAASDDDDHEEEQNHDDDEDNVNDK